MARFGRATPVNGPSKVVGGKWLFPQLDQVGAGTTTATTTPSFTMTINGNCLVAICMTWPRRSFSSSAVGATAMTYLGGVSNNGNSANGGFDIAVLMNPPTGSQTITFTYTVAPSFVAFNAMSYYNVGSTGSIQIASGTGATTSTMAATGIIGGTIVNALSGYAFASATQSGYTQNARYGNTQGTTIFTEMGDALNIQSTSKTFTETYSVSGTWNTSGVAVALNPKLAPEFISA